MSFLFATTGAVNVNLQNLRQRVDKALKDMRLICDNLDMAMRRVQRHQLDLQSLEKALQSDKDEPGAALQQSPLLWLGRRACM